MFLVEKKPRQGIVNMSYKQETVENLIKKDLDVIKIG